ncbi:H-NS family nucleoid-associated regulatory protein [Sulfitobacter aestuariivivens]|uniref:H-NS histone family protein n=1 Tax=Sulfitobacter aestuariivivens TaxID=2766981 RepID=A0A927HEK4_9RHOB|nr:H-NS histone family protein [Sulfitobacter aestuariivivens]MBD3663986.1 H-NS histone family protein [Sulfitobacter aestuariivivens]
MTNELKTMSRKELEKLLNDVKKALQNAQARDRRDARKAAEKAAAEFGFSLGDLAEDAKPARKTRKTKAKKTGPKSAPKYANPADASQTWTGKGRQPNWFRQAVEKGKDPEKMRI